MELWFMYHSTMTEAQMIARRTRLGFNPDESAARLPEVLATFAGDTLAAILAYEGFATEKQAYRFIAAMAA